MEPLNQARLEAGPRERTEERLQSQPSGRAFFLGKQERQPKQHLPAAELRAHQEGAQIPRAEQVNLHLDFLQAPERNIESP